jgi:hypothetical protein
MDLRKLVTTLGLFAVALGAGGCVRIEGGAVEVSWVVRSADGQAITDCSCALPPISRVFLKLRGVGGTIDGSEPCAGAERTHCEFACQRQTGSTPFDIKETQAGEMYEISVAAIGEDGTELTDVLTPAPILRTVVRGQVTELEAFLLVAQCGCGDVDGGMNTSGVCTRP